MLLTLVSLQIVGSEQTKVVCVAKVPAKIPSLMIVQQYLLCYIFKQDSFVFTIPFFHAEEMDQYSVVKGGYYVQGSTLSLTKMGMFIVQRS